MRYLLTCAGTAGHINPAISIADALKQKDPEGVFLFIGSGREMENRLIPQAGYAIENITVTGLQRGFGIKKLVSHVKTVLNLVKGRQQAAAFIRDFRPDVVIGTGGYVCYPVLQAAHAKKIPCFLHESNAVPGLTTKLLNQTADTIFVAFPGVEKAYKHPERVVFAGTPVRAGFSAMTQEEAKESLGLSGKKLVVSFWGSLGARICNQCSAEAIALNEANPQYVQIHATGGGDAGYQSFLQLLDDRGIDKEGCRVTDIRPYIDNMPVVMRAADLVLCRSGASTLGELTAIGKPSVLIPSPYVTDNHQEKNALRLQEGGGAVMLKETECTGQLLHETVSKLLLDETKLADMSRAVAALGVPESAERIADYIRTRLREVPV